MARANSTYRSARRNASAKPWPGITAKAGPPRLRSSFKSTRAKAKQLVAEMPKAAALAKPLRRV